MSLRKIFTHLDTLIDKEFDNIINNVLPKNLSISNVKPSDDEGVEGEIRLYKPNNQEVYMLLKLNNKWYEFNIGNYIEGLSKDYGQQLSNISTSIQQPNYKTSLISDENIETKKDVICNNLVSKGLNVSPISDKNYENQISLENNILSSLKDGFYINGVRLSNQNVYTKNLGNSWLTKLTGSYKKVSCSSTGRYIVCGGDFNYVYLSTDWGQTFVKKEFNNIPSYVVIKNIIVSNDGSLIIIIYDNCIIKSSDYLSSYETLFSTTTIDSISITRRCKPFVVSDDGVYGIKCVNKKVFVTNDSGANWVEKFTSTSSTNNSYVAMSSNGQYQVVVFEQDSKIYVSNNYGSTWTNKISVGSNVDWFKAFVSSTGQYQIVASYTYGTNGGLYISSDYGNNWTRINLGNIIDFDVSSTGQYIYVLDQNNSVRYSNNYGSSFSTYSILRRFSTGVIKTSSSGQHVFVLPGSYICDINLSSTTLYDCFLSGSVVYLACSTGVLKYSFNPETKSYNLSGSNTTYTNIVRIVDIPSSLYFAAIQLTTTQTIIRILWKSDLSLYSSLTINEVVDVNYLKFFFNGYFLFLNNVNKIFIVNIYNLNNPTLQKTINLNKNIRSFNFLSTNWLIAITQDNNILLIDHSGATPNIYDVPSNYLIYDVIYNDDISFLLCKNHVITISNTYLISIKELDDNYYVIIDIKELRGDLDTNNVLYSDYLSNNYLYIKTTYGLNILYFDEYYFKLYDFIKFSYNTNFVKYSTFLAINNGLSIKIHNLYPLRGYKSSNYGSSFSDFSIFQEKNIYLSDDIKYQYIGGLYSTNYGGDYTKVDDFYIFDLKSGIYAVKNDDYIYYSGDYELNFEKKFYDKNDWVEIYNFGKHLVFLSYDKLFHINYVLQENENYDIDDIKLSDDNKIFLILKNNKLFIGNDLENIKLLNFYYDINQFCCSSDCKIIYVINDTGLFRSFDYGENFYKIYNKNDIKSISCSKDGKKVMFICNDGRVIISYDYGENWIYRKIPSLINSNPVIKSSYTAETIVACGYNNLIRISTNFGNTFTPISYNLNNPEFDICLDNDGNILCVADGSYLKISYCDAYFLGNLIITGSGGLTLNDGDFSRYLTNSASAVAFDSLKNNCFAYCNVISCQYYTGTTWANYSIDASKFFDNNIYTGETITYTYRKFRVVIQGNFGWATIPYFMFKWDYTGYSPDMTITIESSSDGSNWVERKSAQISSVGSHTYFLIYNSNFSGNNYARITFDINLQSSESVKLVEIIAINTRASEHSQIYPINTDNNRNVGIKTLTPRCELDVNGRVFASNILSKISETITTSNATFIEYTNLDSTNDYFYFLLGHIKNNNASSVTYSFYINNNNSATNYYTQMATFSGSSSSIARSYNAIFTPSIGNNMTFSFVIFFTLDNLGYLRADTEVNALMVGNVTKCISSITSTFTASSLNTLRIQASLSDGIGTGSMFILGKCRV